MAPDAKGRRVRIAAQCNDHSCHLAGVSFQRFYYEARVFAGTQLAVSQYYGFDVPNNMWDVYNIEAEAMGQQMIFGNQMPDIDRLHPLIAEPSDLDRIRAPNPNKSGRMPWVHEVNKIYLEQTGRPARGYICAPFSLAINIRGYVNFIKDIRSKPAFVHRLLSFLCNEVLAPFAQAIRDETGLPNLTIEGLDAWASPPNITLDIMDEFVRPYVEQLRTALGGNVVTYGNWGEARSGDPERFMRQKLVACPLFLSVLDPDLHELGAQRVRDFAVAHNIPVVAGIDAKLVRDGPPQDIIDRIKHYIDVFARALSLTIYLNHIPMDTPTAHVHSTVAACRGYGQLPIRENLDEVRLDLAGKGSLLEFLSQRDKSLIF